MMMLLLLVWCCAYLLRTAWWCVLMIKTGAIVILRALAVFSLCDSPHACELSALQDAAVDNGLNNARVSLIHAMGIAEQLGRTLIMPPLYTYHLKGEVSSAVCYHWWYIRHAVMTLE